MLCGATVSWSIQVTVLLIPITMTALAGQKLSPELAPEPTPCGMIIVPETLDIAHELELVVDVVVLDVVEGVVVDDVVEIVLVVGVVVEEVLEPGTKMKYAAPAISITTITAAATAPVPIPLFLCSKFIPSNSPN